MIADLINESLNIRLITQNVMSVYSTNKDHTDCFLNLLKRSSYKVNNSYIKSSTDLISYTIKDHNPYENIFKYISKQYNVNTFTEYLEFFNKNHLLWLRFIDLSKSDLLLVEILISLLSDKKIIILDYFDDERFADRIVSLLYNIGLSDKLIIYPCKNVQFGINNSTCQCYVKNLNAIKIQSKFEEDFIRSELQDNSISYINVYPLVYHKHNSYLTPSSYKYSIYDLLLIFLYSIKMLYIKFYNWRIRI
jgi:hypothetical protein